MKYGSGWGKLSFNSLYILSFDLNSCIRVRVCVRMRMGGSMCQVCLGLGVSYSAYISHGMYGMYLNVGIH